MAEGLLAALDGVRAATGEPQVKRHRLLPRRHAARAGILRAGQGGVLIHLQWLALTFSAADAPSSVGSPAGHCKKAKLRGQGPLGARKRGKFRFFPIDVLGWPVHY